MIYFDNAATTKVIDEVAELTLKYMTENYGNPSSLHRMGLNAEKGVKSARGLIAKRLGAKPEQIIFTSGGTEGNNTVILGIARDRAKFGKHLITTTIEHPSVLNCFELLESEGFEVTYLPVNQEGIVMQESLKSALRPDTQLVSIMMVNNELGSIQPIADLGAVLKSSDYQGYFHSDGTQALGKLKMNLTSLPLDFFTAAAHKCHGPKGVGFIYARSGRLPKAYMIGGGQESNQRSGTHNTAGIVGMAKAIDMVYADIESSRQKISGFSIKIRSYFENYGDSCRVYTPQLEKSVPHIIDVAFKHLKAEVLLHTLEKYGIMVSSGSACSTNKQLKVSHVLSAIGAKQEFIDGAIRISMSKLTTEEEVNHLIMTLDKVLPELQAVTGRRF